VFIKEKLKTKFATKLFLIGCSCTVLFDLYHPNLGKIFDILAFLFIFTALFFNNKLYLYKLQLFKENLIWSLPMVIVGLLSIFISPVSAIAITLGLLILLVISYYFEDEIYNNAVTFLTISQKILLITQLIQLIIWVFTGFNLDYGEFLGFNPSRNFDGIFFRASGILAEANGMTVTQSLLYITLLKFRRKNVDMLLFLVSIFITFSLQGAFICLVTLLVFFFSNTTKDKIYFKIFVFLLSLLIFMSSAYEYVTKAYQLFLFRLDKFDDDQSLYYRLLKPITIPFANLLHPHFYDILTAVKYGPGNAYFTGLYFFGVFFFFFLGSSIRKFLGNGFLAPLILLLTLFSYQVYTTALFWLMLTFAEVKDRHDNRLKSF
jgi:hypothetical protein